MVTGSGTAFQQLLAEALGHFSCDRSTERADFSAGQHCVGPGVHSRVDILGQDVVAQFEDDVNKPSHQGIAEKKRFVAVIEPKFKLIKVAVKMFHGKLR
jgi:hypothetical protein